MDERLVWIDCEMSGLDLHRDVLLEVAVLVTDSELNVVDDDGLDLVIAAPDAVLDDMNDVVREMHASSGLTDAVRTSTLAVREAEEQLLAYVKRFVPEPRKAPLCGNSIATDRGFLARDMPALDGWLHYRMVDVSSVKELARRWYPRAYYASPQKAGGHRALADIRESILELRYYREVLFVPQPGPSSETCQTVARDLLAAADDATQSSAALPGDTDGPPSPPTTPAP